MRILPWIVTFLFLGCGSPQNPMNDDVDGVDSLSNTDKRPGSGSVTVTAISPLSGLVSGNEPVKIQGTGFRRGVGIDVYFGGNKCRSVIVEGQTALTVSTPAVTQPGIVDVRVVVDNAKTVTLRNAFNYVLGYAYPRPPR